MQKFVLLSSLYLRGKENGSNVWEVDGDETFGRPGDDQHVGEPEKGNQDQKCFATFAVLLRLGRIGGP